MSWINNINISFSYSPILFFLATLILFVYTIYVYKTTLPAISLSAKVLLMCVRFLSLFLVLLLIFEPIVNISSQTKIEPINLVFIDNSSSIPKFSSQNDINKISELVNDLYENLDGSTEFYTFGSNLNQFKPGLDSLKFNENSTELSSVIREIDNSDNISSILLISDGIINQNVNPESELKNLPHPIFSVGVGDTTESKDLIVEQIISNNFIYAARESEIEVILRNNDFSNTKANVQVFDNDSLIQTRNIELSNTGINRFKVPYLSNKEGRHKLTVKAFTSQLEKNRNNNVLSKMVNVLAAKKKIALISGSPSSDLSFIIKSIKRNEEFTVDQIIEVKSDKFYKEANDFGKVEKADIIFLVGFPNSNSDIENIKKVGSIISSTKTPLFFAFSPSIDFSKMRFLDSVLPFELDGISNNFTDVQVKINYSTQSLLGNPEIIGKAWLDLPPITLTSTIIKPIFPSQILLSSKLNENQPIIFTNTFEGRKSIVVAGSNIWRWKLKNVHKEDLLFDNFILNSIKWLSIRSKDEYLSVSSNKTSYNLGENISFIANLYDETFEPIENELISLKFEVDGELKEFNFSSIGNGIYNLNISPINPGILNYVVELKNNPRNLSAVNGTINIEPINIENMESKMNELFLESISVSTGGIYYKLNQSKNIIKDLNKVFINKIYYKNIDNELRLSSLELILLIIVILFSIEWILRKIFRMI